MLKTLLVTTASVSFVLGLALSSSTAKAGDKDDVFMDEGDGDFDTMPILPQQAEQPAAPAEKPAAKSAAKSSKKKPVARKAAPKKEEPVVAAEPPKQEETPVNADPLPVSEPAVPVADMPGDSPADAKPADAQPETAPAQEEASAAPAAEAKPKKSKKAKTHKTKTAATKTKGGIYVVTNGPCPMTREPASESELMITVKPSKKIWVQEVDEKWVRGFNKAGEPGYISRECVQ